MKTNVLLLVVVFIVLGVSSCYSDVTGDNNVDGMQYKQQTALPQYEHNDTESVDSLEIKNDLGKEIDLGIYFQGVNGCAVVYDEMEAEYDVYNDELSEIRFSPCSTFKIISTLVGLKSNAIENKDSKFCWNGTNYMISEWNRDLTLEEAFKASCVWYFREAIDKSGSELVQQTLTELSYGNCDISQWDGGGINGVYRELNGFWLEGSLLISPMEQVNVLAKIFSHGAGEYEAYVPTLKEIMFIEKNSSGFNIYGKTGTGSKSAWFVGLAQKDYNTYYISVLLESDDNYIFSGKDAKDIALNIFLEM